MLSFKRAGTTLAAESRASKVITHAATTIKPGSKKRKLNQKTLCRQLVVIICNL